METTTTAIATLASGARYEDELTSWVLETILQNEDCRQRVQAALAVTVPTPTSKDLANAVLAHIKPDVRRNTPDGATTLAWFLTRHAFGHIDWSYIWQVVARSQQRRVREPEEEIDNSIDGYEDARRFGYEDHRDSDGYHEGADL
jgi:hypothetical protein